MRISLDGQDIQAQEGDTVAAIVEGVEDGRLLPGGIVEPAVDDDPAGLVFLQRV